MGAFLVSNVSVKIAPFKVSFYVTFTLQTELNLKTDH